MIQQVEAYEKSRLNYRGMWKSYFFTYDYRLNTFVIILCYY